MSGIKGITVDPDIMAGKPVVEGTRIPVYVVLEMLSEGDDIEEINEAYPDLSKEDVKACIEYATKRVQHESLESGESVA